VTKHTRIGPTVTERQQQQPIHEHDTRWLDNNHRARGSAALLQGRPAVNGKINSRV